jgi:hypothetical protein
MTVALSPKIRHIHRKENCIFGQSSIIQNKCDTAEMIIFARFGFIRLRDLGRRYIF